MRRLRRALATVALAGCIAATGFSSSVTRAQDTAPRDRLRFGVIGGQDHAAAANDLGVSWQQITFAWDALQPDGPGALEPGIIDEDALEAARDAGREVVGLIVRTPAWASDSGDPAAVPAGLERPFRDPRNRWAAFVRALVAHYAPLGVHTWVIYDEPDVRPGEGAVQFAGEVADYARLVEVAAQAARASDPTAQIHLSALDWWADGAAGREPYLARLLRVWQADTAGESVKLPFDAVRLRVHDSTAAIGDMLDAARAILDEAGMPETPIAMEASARVGVSEELSGTTPLFGVTPAMQADFVIQAAALALAGNVQRFAYGALIDADARSGAGLLAPDGARRPAFAAYQAAIALFAPTERATLFGTDEALLIELNQGARDIYALWAREEQPVEFIITAGEVNERALRQDAQGRKAFMRAQPYDFPAAYFVDAPGAQRDDNGFLTVAGSPQLMTFDPAGDWYRVVYTVIDGQRQRLR